MIIVGIDPGLDGAIAILRSDTMQLDRIIDIPTMGKGKQRIVNVAVLHGILDAETSLAPVVCWLEYAASRPMQSASATCKQCRTYGNLEAIAVCLDWPLHVVTPAVWKTHFRLARKDWTNAQRKAASRAHATRMFPKHAELFSRAKDDGRAEAALVALYGAERSGVTTEPATQP